MLEVKVISKWINKICDSLTKAQLLDEIRLGNEFFKNNDK